MIRYVVGFAFNRDGSIVTLIRKNRPEWQKGKYNGVGGKVEEGEFDLEAMVREFKEETGADTYAGDWRWFYEITGHEYVVNFYYTTLDSRTILTSATDEMVAPVVVDKMYSEYCLIEFVPNLKWLIPMALEHRSRPWLFMV